MKKLSLVLLFFCISFNGNSIEVSKGEDFAEYNLIVPTYKINEDGFIAYVERNGLSLSFVSDRKQAYYQASGNSDLENLINEDLSPNEISHTKKIIEIYNGITTQVSNEESDVLNRLTDIKPLISFTDREQFIIENLIRKALVTKVRNNGMVMVIANETEQSKTS